MCGPKYCIDETNAKALLVNTQMLKDCISDMKIWGAEVSK